MKRSFHFLTVMIVSVLFAAAAPAQDEKNWPVLDQFIQSSMKDWKVPGVAVAIVRDQSATYMKGFGVRDIETGELVTPNTLFDIGSCTKAFTAASIALLVDEGKLQWDTKVNAVLPIFHLSDPLADENVTIRDLLTHRTGIPGLDFSLFGRSPFTRDEMVRRLAYAAPNAQFRTLFQYNNLMYVTAGRAVGYMTGGTWEEFVQRRIFTPLGMTGTNSSMEESLKAPDHASPHTKKKDGTVVRIPWQNIDVSAPAGAISSNLHDMSRWITFQMNNGLLEGKQLISQKNMREMHTPQMVIPPEGEIPDVFFPHSMQLTYGLGWFIEIYHGHPLILHPGDVQGFSSLVVLIPELHTGYVVLINSHSVYRQVVGYQIADLLLHLPDAGWSDHFKKLERETNAEEQKSEVESKRNAETHPSHDLAAYTGAYSSPMEGEVQVSLQEGKLFLNFYGTNAELSYFQYDTFLVSSRGKTRVTFRLDPDGNVSDFLAGGMEFKRAEKPHPQQ